MKYETIEYYVDNGVAKIQLSRPQRYNSFTESMHKEMRLALKQVAADGLLRCLIITGIGKGFCTGQDLNDRYAMVSEGRPDLGSSLEKNYNRLVQTISELKIPVICAINGVAAGAGVSLALACDIVIACQSAKFVFAFSKVGLVPDAGGSWTLVKALGLPRARALALLGETLTAEQAHSMGLIWKSVPDDALEDETLTTARRLATMPAQGLALTKRALVSAAANNFDEQLTLEAQLQTVAGRSPDYAEAVKAFVEKRPPKFSEHFE